LGVRNPGPGVALGKVNIETSQSERNTAQLTCNVTPLSYATLQTDATCCGPTTSPECCASLAVWVMSRHNVSVSGYIINHASPSWERQSTDSRAATSGRICSGYECIIYKPFPNDENKVPVQWLWQNVARLQYPIPIYHTELLRDQMSFGPVDNYARTWSISTAPR
jgi:hypothetical protein